MNKYTSLTQDYIEYLEMKRYFTTLPKWQLELYNYNNQPLKPITLPPSDMKTAKECLEHIKATY